MNKKSLASFLIIILSIQSCVVYQKSSVSIDDAINTGKVKLITTTDKVIIINNIEQINNEFYGILDKYTIHIPTDEVQYIYLIDKKKTSRSFLIGVGAIVVLTVTFILLTFSYDFRI